MNRTSHFLPTTWISFAYMVVAVAVVNFAAASTHANQTKYLGPSDVLVSSDAKTIYVLCADADKVMVLDSAGKSTASIDLPAAPGGFVLSPDGKTLYVTCGAADGRVCLIDTASAKIAEKQIAVGHTPCGPAVSPDGKRLYVCNRFNDDVSVIDLVAAAQIARVPATREPVAAAAAPDGSRVLVSNLLPVDRADSYDVACMVTLIDTASNKPASIRLPNGSSSAHGICISPNGKYAFVAHILSRYQMPTTQLERGWMNTNALSIIDVPAGKLVNTVLLDDVDLGAANPWGVAVTADGKQICVTHAGTQELSVIDAPGLLEKLSAMPATLEELKKKGEAAKDSADYSSLIAGDVPNDLAFLVDIRRRIKLPGNGPRGLAISGAKAYVAEFFSDDLAIVELPPAGSLAAKSIVAPRTKVSTVRLGPQPVLTAERKGQMHFHDAALCFQNWQSCSSCHPDARVDGLNWDLMNDGMGNPKNVRSMLLSHKTPPSMSIGVRSTAESAVRAGIKHIQFAVRPDEDAQAIDAYLKALQPVPSPRLVGGKLSPAAERGRQLFNSDATDCSRCHPAPLYTDMKMHNVGSKGQFDRGETFDTPTLIECWRTAPYMHDGHYTTIGELLTKGNHGHGLGKGDAKTDLKKLTDEQINELVEFVLSL